MSWPIALAIVACVLFVLAALNVGHERVSVGWAGLAFLTAAFLLADTFAVAG